MEFTKRPVGIVGTVPAKRARDAVLSGRACDATFAGHGKSSS
jgi:hypothetical protein